MTTLHQAARLYAGAGFKIFPCLPMSKIPATTHGFHEATDDLTQIDEWWTENPAYNIAFSPHTRGWGIVDIDSPEAAQNWMARTGDDPDTWTIRSPRNGLHIYYEGELPTSVGRLVPGQAIDTRGRGSYALLPPSQTKDGHYRMETDADVAPLPGWVTGLLADMRKGGAVSAEDGVLDLEVNVSRAIAWLKSREPVLEGDHADERTYATACALRDMGLSAEAIFAVMSEHYQIEPKDERFDNFLATKIENATRYRQNEGSVHAARSPRELFASYVSSMVEDDERPEAGVARKPGRFHPRSEAEQDAAEDPKWLIPNLMPDDDAVMLYGPTQSFKSFVALDLALSIAANHPTFAGSPLRTGPVFYAALEGRKNIEKMRRPAWKEARKVTRPIPFYSLPAPMVLAEGQCEEFERELKAHLVGERPALIVFDTYAKVMSGLDENKTKDMSPVITWIEHLVDEFHCTVLVVHHTGREGTHSRGSSAVDAGFGTILVATADRPSKMVKVAVQKHKDAEEPAEPWYLSGAVVRNSLVFTPCSKADYMAATKVDIGLSVAKVQRILAEVKAFEPANAVTSHVLASHMVDQDPVEGESAAETEARKDRMVKTLKRAGRTEKFAAYVSQIGNAEPIWCIPQEAPNAA